MIDESNGTTTITIGPVGFIIVIVVLAIAFYYAAHRPAPVQHDCTCETPAA